MPPTRTTEHNRPAVLKVPIIDVNLILSKSVVTRVIINRTKSGGGALLAVHLLASRRQRLHVIVSSAIRCSHSIAAAAAAMSISFIKRLPPSKSSMVALSALPSPALAAGILLGSMESTSRRKLLGKEN